MKNAVVKLRGKIEFNQADARKQELFKQWEKEDKKKKPKTTGLNYL